jgi:hypothetical protein
MSKFLFSVAMLLALNINGYSQRSAGSGNPSPPPIQAKYLYLDLMKKSLTNWIYGDTEKPVPMDPAKRIEGLDWPPTAHTMIGLKRLDNLQFCIEDVLTREVPGDIIECGVWRGGSAIFMRAVLKVNNVTNRIVYAADSFEGCPKPDLIKYPQEITAQALASPVLAVSLEEVKNNFDHYGLLDDQVTFLKGWFKDTLPHASIKQIAVLRLDGDMYESTMDSLVNLYPKVSVGGYIIIDDYGAIAACRQAVTDYRKQKGIGDIIMPIDLTGAFWRKSK